MIFYIDSLGLIQGKSLAYCFPPGLLAKLRLSAQTMACHIPWLRGHPFCRREYTWFAAHCKGYFAIASYCSAAYALDYASLLMSSGNQAEKGSFYLYRRSACSPGDLPAKIPRSLNHIKFVWLNSIYTFFVWYHTGEVWYTKMVW